jgi:large subunit ribosomal protein L10
MAHVAKWKEQEVADLVKLIKESPVVALAQVDGIPSAQMQKMRAQLRGDANLKVSKNTLLNLALKEVAKEQSGAEELITKIEGSTAVITTEMSPFRLFKTLEAAKTKAPARGGDKAPEDINIKKGDTPFKPGPVVGDLQKAGIPAKIDQGKVVISANKLLVKAGDPIPQDVAQMLTRLEIYPMTVGIDLKAAFDEGTVYGVDALSVDYVGQVAAAHQQAMNLALNAGIPEKGTVEPLIAMVHGKALGLGVFIRDKDESALDEKTKSELDKVGAAAAAAAPAAAAAAEEEEKEEEEEEGPSEEEAMGGLGSLFG